MKKVILEKKPKDDVIYLEDLPLIYNYVIVIDNIIILVETFDNKFRWFDFKVFKIYEEEYKTIKEAIEDYDYKWNISSIEFYEKDEFDIPKLLK